MPLWWTFRLPQFPASLLSLYSVNVSGRLNRRFAVPFHFFEDSFPDSHPFKDNVYVVSGLAQDRENGVAHSFGQLSVWFLGSSGYSAQLAGRMELPFGFAAQLAPENMMMALDLYRKNLRPSAVLDKPYALACFGIFADVQEAKLQVRIYA